MHNICMMRSLWQIDTTSSLPLRLVFLNMDHLSLLRFWCLFVCKKMPNNAVTPQSWTAFIVLVVDIKISRDLGSLSRTIDILCDDILRVINLCCMGWKVGQRVRWLGRCLAEHQLAIKETMDKTKAKWSVGWDDTLTWQSKGGHPSRGQTWGHTTLELRAHGLPSAHLAKSCTGLLSPSIFWSFSLQKET